MELCRRLAAVRTSDCHRGLKTGDTITNCIRRRPLEMKNAPPTTTSMTAPPIRVRAAAGPPRARHGSLDDASALWLNRTHGASTVSSPELRRDGLHSRRQQTQQVSRAVDPAIAFLRFRSALERIKFTEDDVDFVNVDDVRDQFVSVSIELVHAMPAPGLATRSAAADYLPAFSRQ